MDYGEVLTKAWQIIWKFKVLWLFGVLAACSGSGNIANYEFSSPPQGMMDQFSYLDTYEYEFDSPEEMELYLENFSQDFVEAFKPGYLGFIPDDNTGLLIFGGLTLGLIIGIIAFVIGTVGRVGLTVGAMQADGGKESFSFGDLFQDSQPFLTRALGLNLLIAVAGLLVGFVLGVGVFGISVLTLGFGLLCVIPLLCLLFPAAVFISLVISQANAALVVEDLSIMDAVKRGWAVTIANIAPLLVIWLVLVVGMLIVGFGIGLPISMIFGLSSFVGAQASSSAPLVLVTIALIIFYPVFLFLNGVLQSYLQSTWTLTFLRLTRGTPIDDSPEAVPTAT